MKPLRGARVAFALLNRNIATTDPNTSVLITVDLQDIEAEMLGLDTGADMRSANCDVRSIWDESSGIVTGKYEATVASSSVVFAVVSGCQSGGSQQQMPISRVGRSR